ncbi:DUF4097 domain-containing protein [Plantactinospora siamensis]|uniref:DUF4097 domain-containing protein n=1 Tax=Plantactinospora siamensis TaxID=555372 RepID=A0ABV6NSW5_9ACTN
MTEFPVTGPITLVIEVASGDIEVIAEEGSTATVDIQPSDRRDASRELAEATTTELNGDTLRVIAPRRSGGFLRRDGSLRVRAIVPVDSTVRVDCASADVALRGALGEVHLDGASSDLRIEQLAGGRIKTASGDVEIGRATGQLSVGSASGDVVIEHAGGATRISTASGDIKVQEAGGDVQVKTASGDTRIDTARHGSIRIDAASGDVRVGVVAGTGVWLDLHTMSGDTRNELAMHDGPGTPANGHQLGLQVRTMSGDIDIRRVEVR